MPATTMPSAYLFAPAYPLEAESLLRARTAAGPWATALGVTVVESPDLAHTTGPGAWRPATERRADLQRGLRHDLLVAARGGYGCLDLLEDWIPPARWPLLIGYSDLTVLHAIWGGESLYGFMPGVPHGHHAVTSSQALALGRGQILSGRGLRPGTAQGPLFAGCLRVLTGLIGTPWMPDLQGHLLAIEDIDERPYRLDRDLWQLFHSGALQGITGLIGGLFPARLPEGYTGPSADAVLTTWAERLGVPALGGLAFGHDPDPVTLAVRRFSRLIVDDHPRLIQDPRP